MFSVSFNVCCRESPRGSITLLWWPTVSSGKLLVWGRAAAAETWHILWSTALSFTSVNSPQLWLTWRTLWRWGNGEERGVEWKGIKNYFFFFFYLFPQMFTIVMEVTRILHHTVHNNCLPLGHEGFFFFVFTAFCVLCIVHFFFFLTLLFIFFYYLFLSYFVLLFTYFRFFHIVLFYFI